VNISRIGDFASTVLIDDNVGGHIVAAAVVSISVAAANALNIGVIDVMVDFIIAIVIGPDAVNNNVVQTDVPVANLAFFSTIL
jgi:hypothetical protein